MTDQGNAINWFEIPVHDFARAKRFYESMFEMQMAEQMVMGMPMAFFPANPTGAGGSLIKSPAHIPSEHGALVYLNANPDLSKPLDRVEKLGGKVILPKKAIGDNNGFMGIFTDSEGNRIGLHSNL